MKRIFLPALALFLLLLAASSTAQEFTTQTVSLQEFGITALSDEITYTIESTDSNNYIITGDVNGLVIEQIFSAAFVPPENATYLSSYTGCEAYYAPMESYNLANNRTTQSNYQFALCSKTSSGGWHCLLNRDNPTNYCHYSVVNMSTSCPFRQQYNSQCGSTCSYYSCNNLDHWGPYETICTTISALSRKNTRMYYDYSCGAQCYATITNESYSSLSSCTSSCSGGACSGEPTCTSSECDSQDYFGNWEYYCSGNDSRKKQKYFNYSCGSSGCYLASSNYVNDSLYENCGSYYGCNSSTGFCNTAPSCSETCNDDGYTCNGNTREYRDYYCLSETCTYSTISSKNCDEEDRYGEYQYYCSGNERRKHRIFYNYSCSGGSCTSTNTYVDDALEQTCEYGCNSETNLCEGCSGTLTVNVTDWYDNALTDAEVYLNSDLQGVTNSSGQLIIPTSANTCPETYSINVIAQGKDCGTRTAQISYAGDNTTLFFPCKVPKPQLKMNLNTGAEHYLGDNVALGVEVKDNENMPVDYADVGIWDPFKKTRVWKQTLSGLVEYLTNANATGYFTFTALARKPGFSQAYGKKQILVKGYGEIAVHAQTKSGEPIADADVKFNGSHVGFTNSEGTFAMEAGEGTHNIEVCANGSCMSKTTQLSHEGDVDELWFELEWMSGDLAVVVLSPEGSPIMNAYIELDEGEARKTNVTGAVYYKDISLSEHSAKIYLEIKETADSEPQYFETSANITLDSEYLLKKFVLTTDGFNAMAMEVQAGDVLVMIAQNIDLNIDSAAVVKGRLIMDSDLPVSQPISLETESCVKFYWNNGGWAEGCKVKSIWLADEVFVSGPDSEPVAINCFSEECFPDPTIPVTIFLNKHFTTQAGKYIFGTHTDKGGSHISAKCLKKLGLVANNIPWHANFVIHEVGDIIIPGVNPAKTRIYDSHVGPYKDSETGEQCAVFYESDSKLCEKSCDKSLKDYIKRPPAPYPMKIPANTLNNWIDKAIKHNQLESGWEIPDNFNPMMNIGVAVEVAAPVVEGALFIGGIVFVVWEAIRPIRCLGAGVSVILTGTASTPVASWVCIT